ncbi:hypothetical protein HKD37_18G050050 [Glycine soja]
MALSFFHYCCFSESSESKEFICEGEVCMLRDRKKYKAKKSKSQKMQRDHYFSVLFLNKSS